MEPSTGRSGERRNKNENAKKNQGVTLRHKKRSENIRRKLGVSNIKEKTREMRLRWYGHVMRMSDENQVKAVINLKYKANGPEEDQRQDVSTASQGTCVS